MCMSDTGILAIWGDWQVTAVDMWTGLTFKQRSHHVLISKTVFYCVAAVVRKWQRQHLMELYRYNGILNKGEVRSLIYQYTESRPDVLVSK